MKLIINTCCCFLLFTLSMFSAGAEAINFVVILTDDQRWDTLWAMPILQDKLVSRGVTFTSAYASTPLCCPFRASFLSGGYYAKNTNVLENKVPNGSFYKFQDANSLAARLAGIGYQNAMIGKYLRASPSGYTPPGWSYFYEDWTFDSALLTQKALEFLDTQDGSPFFLYLAPYAPHYPAEPSVEDENLFQDFTYRGRGYDEADFSDKPKDLRLYGGKKYTSWFNSVEQQDEYHRDQLRTLQGVDRAIGSIVDKIEAIGQLDNTMIVFMSDNGYLWGEHSRFGKLYPYEEGILIPLVVYYPGISPGSRDELIVGNLDIPATILELAGLTNTGDGANILPVLSSGSTEWREEFLIDCYGADNKPTRSTVWSGLRHHGASGNWKYVEYTNGDKELYDLTADPYELESQHGNPDNAALMREFSLRLQAQKGLMITRLSKTLSRGMEGLIYYDIIKAWGGDGGYVWSVAGGSLPDGLSLNESTGEITGIPVVPGLYEVDIKVQGQAISSYTGLPQSYIKNYVLTIDKDTDGDLIADDSDNCPVIYNPGQENNDNDFMGDVCDSDDDNDGLLDVDEVIFGTDTFLPDTDSDGLLDGDEVNVYNTNPKLGDTDGDRLLDGVDPLPLIYNYADGDIAPVSGPDTQLNAADMLLAIRIVLGLVTPTDTQLAHGDVYPAGSPDGRISLQDLLIMQMSLFGTP